LSSRAFLSRVLVGFVPPENLRRGRRPSVRPVPVRRRRRQPRVVFLPGGLRRSPRRSFGVGVSLSFRDRGVFLRLSRERAFVARTLRRGFIGEVAAVKVAAASDRREPAAIRPKGLVPDRDADRQRVALVERRRDARATQRAEQRAGRVVRVFRVASRRKRQWIREDVREILVFVVGPTRRPETKRRRRRVQASQRLETRRASPSRFFQQRFSRVVIVVSESTARVRGRSVETRRE
jgi:hypothetical protein